MSDRRWSRAWRAGWFVTLLVAAAPGPAAANHKPDLSIEGPGGSRFRLEVYERIRGEFADWFDPGPPIDPRWSFFAHRMQLGVRGQWKALEGFLQYQQVVLANIPDDGTGLASVYYANTMRQTQVGNFVRQGWLHARHAIGDLTLSVQTGRILYSDGGEITLADPVLEWVKKERVSQRLIGPFDFTHVGRSFDGGVAQIDHPTFNLTGFGFLPTSGGFEIDGGRTIPAINLGGVSALMKPGAVVGGLDSRLFWFRYSDDRPAENDITVLDNRPLAVREADREPLDVHSIGANLISVHRIGQGTADFLVWTVGQVGSWQSQAHRAWSYALEGGYQMPAWWAKPWLRIGINRSSGDDDPDDDVHETFFQVLPTARLYAMTPFYNMMNNQDVFVQLLTKPLESAGVDLSFHHLRATAGNDLVYSGGGATKRDFFGYAGFPAGGRHDLAYLVDVAVSYQACSFLKLAGYYGHAFGQGIAKAAFVNDDMDYGFVEMVIAF